MELFIVQVRTKLTKNNSRRSADGKLVSCHPLSWTYRLWMTSWHGQLPNSISVSCTSSEMELVSSLRVKSCIRDQAGVTAPYEHPQCRAVCSKRWRLVIDACGSLSYLSHLGFSSVIFFLFLIEERDERETRLTADKLDSRDLFPSG